jgi:hypothetical protein
MMKQLSALAAAVVVFSAGAGVPCTAQTLTMTASDFAAAKIFESSPGFTITGMGASPSGDLFYLEGDAAFPPTVATTLYKRAASDQHSNAVPLFRFDTPAFGAFVVFHNGLVYFGESSAGTIHAMAPDGTAHLVLGSVPGIYDLSFSGDFAFVSANPETDFAKPPRNKIYRFDLSSGALDPVLDTGGDYSGPLEFDSSGKLLYGATAVSGIRDLHAFSAAEVASAVGPGELMLAPPSHTIIANGKNVYLAFTGANSLWKDDFTTLTMHDISAGSSRTIASTSDALGQLDAAAQNLFVTVTSFGTARSAVFEIAPIPEPRFAALCTLGLVPLLLRQRRSHMALS